MTRAALRLMACTSILSLLLAVPAFAQDTSSADGSDVQDIVVTAQFRATNVQDTPLAITALTGAALTERGAVDVQDLARTAPSVTLLPAPGAFGRTVISYIRGVGANDFNPGFDPSVGYYIDDVYHAALAGSQFDLLDLERVEILRGPQGTLFGKNTIGGAIRLIAKQPNGRFGGSGSVTYGSFDRIDIRGAINIPIIGDELAMRIAGVHKERRGYINRYDFGCLHPALAGSLPREPNAGSDCLIGHEGGENVDGVRAALRAAPSGNIEINLVADYVDDRSDPGGQVLGVTGPDAVLNQPSAANAFPINPFQNIPRFGIPYDDRFLPPNPFTNYSTYANPITGERFEPQARNREYGFSGTIDVALSDDLKVKSITAYRDLYSTFTYDGDASPLPLVSQMNYVNYDQFSQEVQLIGQSFDRKLDWVVGGYYFKGDASYDTITDLMVVGLRIPSGNQFKIRDYSAFAHLTLHLSDKLNLTGGLRFTSEQKDFAIQQLYSCYAPGGTGETTIFPLCLPQLREVATPLKYERWDPKISIDYAITDDVMIYAQYSTGFRGGGFNNRPFTPDQVFPVSPETLSAYELGLRTQFMDRALTLNLTGFQSDYKNMQITVTGTDSAGVPFSAPLNVGDARIRGIELEGRFAKSGFELTMAANYLDAKISEARQPGSIALAPGTLPPKGTPLPNAPKWKVNVGAQYEADLGSVGTLTPRIDWAYQSEIDYDLNFSSPLSIQKGYSLVNARLTWSDRKGLSVSGGVTNLFDKYYDAYLFDSIAQGLGFLGIAPGRPREWSVTVRKEF